MIILLKDSCINIKNITFIKKEELKTREVNYFKKKIYRIAFMFEERFVNIGFYKEEDRDTIFDIIKDAVKQKLEFLDLTNDEL